MKKTFITLALLLSSTFSTKVQAAADYDEMTYDDLVHELSEKKDRSVAKTRRKDFPTHLGLGILQTWGQVSGNGKSYSRAQSGFEVSSGMDLNSDRARAEVAFRNYAETTSGELRGALREINTNFQFRREMNATWSSLLKGGIAIRLLQFEGASEKVTINETSSMFLAGAGLESRLSPTVSIVGDATLRSPFGSSTSDRNSFDIGVKLDTQF